MTRKWCATLSHPMMHSHTKFGVPTSKNIKDILRTHQFLKLGQRSSQGHSDPKMIYDTLSSQYAFTHQIWNSYHKENRRYAPDSMQFLETRSEVKFKVTVTQLWYVTLPHLKMHPHTKFEIPTSNNISSQSSFGGIKKCMCFQSLLQMSLLIQYE